MKDLQIAVKGEYFDEIKSGEKTEEFRLHNDYWCKRLIGRSYRNLILTRGYPPSGDKSRHHIIRYRGYREIKILHRHFGTEPVKVFALQLTPHRNHL